VRGVLANSSVPAKPDGWNGKRDSQADGLAAQYITKIKMRAAEDAASGED
jgi:hypothetical protein